MPPELVQLFGYLGAAYRRGPRPSLMWAVVFIVFAIGFRIMFGLPLPDPATLTVLVSGVGSLGAFLAHMRSQEYKAGVANMPAFVPDPVRGVAA